MSGTLFERFVCRVGGLPATLVRDLHAADCVCVLEELATLESRIDALREPLSDRLFAAVGGNEDPAQRRSLLALRRSLHNRRPLDPETAADFVAEIAGLGEILAFEAKVRQLERDFEELFPRELAASRQALARHLAERDFENALLISSPVLFGGLPRYRAMDAGAMSAKDRQIERGLLKYITRMALKSTPFSTFCSILPGRIEGRGTDRGGGVLRLEGPALTRRSFIRLNKAFLTIFDHQFRRHEELRLLLRVELNTTLRLEGENTLLFLASSGPREIFQRLPTQPVLELITSELRERQVRPSLGELVAALAAHPELESAADEVKTFLDRLVEFGFLRLSLAIPSQDLDWDATFCALYGSAPAAQAACDFLREARRLADAYGESPIGRRQEYLNRLQELFEEYRRRHAIEHVVRGLIYEDAGSPARALVDREGLRAIERDLVEYVERSAALTVARRDLQLMRHFFDHHYGEAVVEVPLLRFYEDFYREVFKRHIEQEKRAARGEGLDPSYDLKNPLGLESLERRAAARRALAALTGERWQAAGSEGEIHLDSADLDAILGDIEKPGRVTGWSVSMYLDLFEDAGEQARAVLRNGAYFFGFGKFFSRFLYLFPADFERDLRARNQAISAFTLAELNDDANFNPNLHPPMMQEAIRYPGCEPRAVLPGVPPGELVVRRDHTDSMALELHHPATGRRILPVDTGFISFDARPPLYRLLGAFTPAPSFAFPLPEGAGTGVAAPDRILVRPRVVFNRRLVLFRRSFLVPARLFPRKGNKEGEAAYFRRVDAWRREHGIPREVYGRIQPLAGAEKVPENETSKPQFFDFGSPLLVDLFAAFPPERGEFMVILEERLPGEAALARCEEGPVVTELVVQLDFPGEGSTLESAVATAGAT